MKKIILLLAMLAVISGCDKEQGNETVPETGNEQESITSLAGTVWTTLLEYDNGDWTVFEFAFTSTHCTYSATNRDGSRWGETGTYVYNSPALVIKEDRYTNTGEVENGIMKLSLCITYDIFLDLELKKRQPNNRP